MLFMNAHTATFAPGCAQRNVGLGSVFGRLGMLSLSGSVVRVTGRGPFAAGTVSRHCCAGLPALLFPLPALSL